MKKVIALAAVFGLSAGSISWAGKTNIYESEDVKIQTFNAKVKSIRDAGDEGVDITFDSDAASGFYSLSPKKMKNYAEIHQIVEKSRKANGPQLKVTAEKDEKIIRSITIIEKAEKPADKKVDVDATIDSILKGN